jgi:threonine/homoserine/homoserine lactone efflux protein
MRRQVFKLVRKNLRSRLPKHLKKSPYINIGISLAGLVLTLASWVVLLFYLYKTNWNTLEWMGGFYLCVITSELFFSERKIFFKQKI